MAKTYLKFPRDGWQKIEAAVTANPQLLKAGDWHTMRNGEEAMTPDDIERDNTAHCLMGWIIRVTPKATHLERLRLDVDNFANEILKNAGQAPIPSAIINGTEEDMYKIVKRRSYLEKLSSTSPYLRVVN